MSDHGTLIAPVPALDDILVTDELTRRKSRPPDHKAEADALHALARRLGDEPRAIVQELVALAVRLCWAGSAGLSLLEETPGGKPVFRWIALAGAYEPFEGGTTPATSVPAAHAWSGRAAAPPWPARLFTYFQGIEPPIVEALVVPLPDAAGRTARHHRCDSHRRSRRRRTSSTAEDVPLHVQPLPNFTRRRLAAPRRPARQRKKRPGADGAPCRSPRPRPYPTATGRRRCAPADRDAGRGRPRRGTLPGGRLAHELRPPRQPLRRLARRPYSQGSRPGRASDSRKPCRAAAASSPGPIERPARPPPRIRQGKDGPEEIETMRPRRRGSGEPWKPSAHRRRPLPRPGGRRRPEPQSFSRWYPVPAWEQVLVNLLHNAAKYTEVGGRIRLTVEPGAGRRSSASAIRASAWPPRWSGGFSTCTLKTNGAGKCRKGAWALASRWFARWSSCTAAGCRSSATAPAGAASS